MDAGKPRKGGFILVSRSLKCVGLAVIVIAACSILGSGCKSKPTGRQVVLYTSVDQELAEPIIAEFQRQTGITVLPKFDTEASKTVGLVQRIRAEASHPQADVFWSNEIFHTIRLAEDGLLAGQSADKSAASRPARYQDSQDRWQAFAMRARVIAYSTQRVKADEAPRSLEDLLDAKWKGRIAMANPQFGTTGGDVASWFVHYGPDKARSILEALKANDVLMVPGNSDAVRAVANGRADIAMTDSDDVYAAKRNGWAIEMNYLDQGGEGVLTIPNTVAIIRGASNTSEAKELVAFLHSEKVERLLAQSESHNTPLRAELAAEFPAYAISRPMDIDYQKVAVQLPIAIRLAGEILGQ
jgi:iron(III) transport system substrate-binding protein